MRRILLLSIICAAIFLNFEAVCPQQNVAEKIQIVENSLLPPVVINGAPVLKWSVSERLDFHRVPGVSVAVINDNKIEWARGYGFKEAGGSNPVTAQTLFQAASISKPIAAMAALYLVQTGQLNLDEPVNNKLKTWKVPENNFTNDEKVTLRRLLTHSAGLTVHGFPGYSITDELPDVVKILNGEKPANTDPIRVDILPGSLWRYSGGGYTVMQLLLEDITGTRLPEIVNKLVFDKIGMANSTYEQPLPESKGKYAATGHTTDGRSVEGKWHIYPEMAAAGLWTTPTDLAKYLIEVQLSWEGKSNKVLSKTMVDQMLTPHLGGYGLGPGMQRKDALQTFGHGGSNNGFKCQMIAFVRKGMGAVVMTNGDDGSVLASEILRGIAKVYDWGIFNQREETVVSVNPAIFEEYTGEFKIVGVEDVIVKITIESGKLFVDALGQKYELHPRSEREFFTIENGWSYIFNKENDKLKDVKVVIGNSPQYTLVRNK